MKRKAHRLIAILAALSCIAPGLGWAQGQGDAAGLMQKGYDLLEQGKFEQAREVYESLLKKDPGHPLALNNLAAIMVKQGKYDQAIAYLTQALPRASGFKVPLDRVCNLDGVCAARGISHDRFGSEDLEGVVKSNLLMVEMARSARPGKP
jgi:tetratricopeptide (TPR) repeat protein